MKANDKWPRAWLFWPLFCASILGMQCYARTQCPDDQGASWSPVNGTVCFGERK